MKKLLTLLAICFSATVSCAAADPLQVGATVDFDRVTSTNPNLGAWDRGVIIGTSTIGGQPYLKIRNKAGTPYTIPNDPRWIHVADPVSAGPVPDGTKTGPYAGATGRPAMLPAGGPGQAPTTARAPDSVGRFPSGTRVEFDRVEGSKPEYGRWDTGTVVGKDQSGRVQIRGENGIMYSIHDDPRWILPAGTPLPGPRHDYLDRPAPPGPREISTTPKGGSGGPLTGEWAVVAMDGKATGGHGMTFNFVGSRYELIFQGSAQSGTFTVSGSSVRMIGEDGAPFGTFQFSIQGNRLELKAPGTDFVLERAHL
jgi:hypothetical protein